MTSTATAKKLNKKQVSAIKPGTWIVAFTKNPPSPKKEVVLLLESCGRSDSSVRVFIPSLKGLRYVNYTKVVAILDKVVVPAIPDMAAVEGTPIVCTNAHLTGAKVDGSVNEVKKVKVPAPDWPFGDKTLDNAPAATKASKDASKTMSTIKKADATDQHLATFGESPASAMKAGKVVKTGKMKAAMDAAVKDLKTVLDKKVVKAVGKKPKAKIVKKVEKVKAQVVKGIKKDLKTNELAKGKKVATKRIENAKFA